MMLLGDVLIPNLKDVSVRMWNGPLDLADPSYIDVEVIGVVEEYHLSTVCLVILNVICV
jgi:hypothetical protein